MFSRNAASSRAIPFAKMVKDIQEDPFIPIYWQKDHKGMQGTEYCINPKETEANKIIWLRAKDKAVQEAINLNQECNITKQLCNRLLEPFQWYTCLVTATEWENFFELRCPKYELSYYPLDRPEALEPTEISFRSKKDYNNFILKLNWTSFQDEQEWYRINTSQAEIHIQALAEAMWDARNESTPKVLKAGDWHIPFGDRIELARIDNSKWVSMAKSKEDFKVKVATARCARLSYMTFDGEIDYQKDIKLHDQLLESKHFSPFEHCARAMSDEEYYTFIKGKLLLNDEGDSVKLVNTVPSNLGWCNNFKGFIPYRYILENNI